MKYQFSTQKEPFARGFLSCESSNRTMKFASGLLCAAENMPLKINLKTGFPYAFFNNMNVFVCYGRGLAVESEGLDRLAEEEPEFAEDYNYIKREMSPLDTGAQIWSVYSEDERKLSSTAAVWGGSWIGHAVPNLIDAARYGTDCIRDKIAGCRKNNPEKNEFYDGELLALEAIDTLGRRFKALAEDTLRNTGLSEDEVRKLKRVIRTFETAPKKPCTDFYGACAVYIMLFSFDAVESPGSLDSPGHFDQYMLPFYRNTAEDERKEVLEAIWQFFHDTRTWNLCIGGSNADGEDLTNELTYDILDTAIKFRYQTPNITMRVHSGTPEALLKKAADSIATGIGMPALYNDQVVCAAYEALGMPPSDSHEYVMNGCNQIDIQGKSHMGLEDGEVNFGKAMEFVLSNGIDQHSGEKVSISTGDPAGFTSFDEVYNALLAQIEHLADVACGMSNKVQRMFAEKYAFPFRSLFIEGCLEKGIDYKAGGPLYGHGQILIEGMADTFDSLAAIRKFVFEEKRFSMKELCDAISADYDGYETIYAILRNSPYRFGNGIDWVDKLAASVTDHFMKYLKTINTVRGGVYGGGCSPFNRAADNGRHTGALPNGKRLGETLFADGIGAVPGRDVHGPTLALKSAMQYNQTEALSGFILNLKFEKSLFQTDNGKDNFISLVKAYFANGGQELQVNVLDRDELLAAQQNPEAYSNLIVRVGGYSDYFNNLTKDLQDNIIARTEFLV